MNNNHCYVLVKQFSACFYSIYLPIACNVSCSPAVNMLADLHITSKAYEPALQVNYTWINKLEETAKSDETNAVNAYITV